MSIINDILDRILGSGASTTMAGSGVASVLYSLADKFFPKSGETITAAQADPVSFWVGVALILLGGIWHKPAVELLPGDEPQ
jgi:hypothetical protein